MFVDALIGERVGWGRILGAVLVVLQMFVGSAARSDDLSVRFGSSGDAAGVVVDHGAFANLLDRFTVVGADGVVRVDYRGLKGRDQAELKAYISRLAETDVLSLNRREQFAFWANLYNAKTLDIVLDHYPVRSIKDVALGGGLLGAFTRGPWKAKVVTVGGVALSLDDIEHGIMRPVFKDPRVHYAVNCASIGCPDLPREPFTGKALEVQLDKAARAYVNHPRGVTIQGQDVIVSSIYDWYKVDFGGDDAGLLAHLRRYAEAPLRAKLEGASDIADHRYDWSLNDVIR